MKLVLKGCLNCYFAYASPLDWTKLYFYIHSRCGRGVAWYEANWCCKVIKVWIRTPLG